MTERFALWAAATLVFVTVGLLFLLLNRLSQAEGKRDVDQVLARLWPTMGVFEIAVGVLLALYGQWVNVIPLVVLGLVFVLKNPATRWWTRRLPPVPPTNVRIGMPDGAELPVELVYMGVEREHGCHAWEAVPTSPELPTGARLLVDKLPPRTMISVRVRREGT